MTPTPRPPRTPRPTAEYRWTQAKTRAFIEALCWHGKVAPAARAVGMTRQSAYRLRDRHPKLAEVWPHALALGRARRLGPLAGEVTLPDPQGDTSGIAR